MADILLDNQTVPSTPAAGKTNIFTHSTNKIPCFKNDAGTTGMWYPGITVSNTTDSVASAAVTYLTGSGLTVPVGSNLQIGTVCRWRLGLTKNAAGTTAFVYTVRCGTAGTTGDAIILTFTSSVVQTAATDTGWADIEVVIRGPLGAACIAAGIFKFTRQSVASTGFMNNAFSNQVLQATSGAFTSTTANLIVGLACDPGAANFTHQVVYSEMLNI
jgi:hypothetical protein